MFTPTNCVYRVALVNVKFCDFPGLPKRIHDRIRERVRELAY